MSRMVALFTFTLLLFPATFAFADFYDDCVEACLTAQTQCVEGITLYDEMGVKEARQACANDYTDCKTRCHADDAKEHDEVNQARARQQAEEAEKKRLEEQESVGGGIKMYKIGD